MALGLLLLLVGALAVVAAVFTAAGSNVELLGFDLSALGLYLIGLGSGAAILWGFGLTKWGTKRNLRQRRETRRLNRAPSESGDGRDRHRDDGDDERAR